MIQSSGKHRHVDLLTPETPQKLGKSGLLNRRC